MQGRYKNKAYTLRKDEEIIEQLKQIAAEQDRTLNKQIERCLKEWLNNNNANKIKESLISTNTENKMQA